MFLGIWTIILRVPPDKKVWETPVSTITAVYSQNYKRYICYGQNNDILTYKQVVCIVTTVLLRVGARNSQNSCNVSRYTNRDSNMKFSAYEVCLWWMLKWNCNITVKESVGRWKGVLVGLFIFGELEDLKNVNLGCRETFLSTVALGSTQPLT